MQGKRKRAFFVTAATAALGALVLAANPFYLFAAQPLEDKGEIVWYRSYDKAFAQAKLTGKPIFLEFRCIP